MKLPSIPLLVLDTETTGFVPVTHRVIEYACTVIKDGKVVKEYEQLLSIEKNEIPQVVQVLTQIRPEHLQGKPMFGEVFETIQSMLKPETVIVGQNIPFDLKMLKGEGWDITDSPWIDTAMLASVLFPELKSYSLGYMSAALNLTHEPRHRALGDVRATTQMLSLCTERLENLPATDFDAIKALALRGPTGYRKFFASLLPSKKRKKPDWLSLKKHADPDASDLTIPATMFEKLPLPTVGLAEESLSSATLSSVLAGAKRGTIIAVKNLDASLRRIEVPEGVTVLPSPDSLLSQEAAERFLCQPVFTADELTLAIKLLLYQPATKSDLPIHGDENAVWAAKLAASEESPEYLSRRRNIGKSAVLMSHHELVTIAAALPSAFGNNTRSLCKNPIAPGSVAEDKGGMEPLKNRLMRGSKPKFREAYQHTLSEILAKLTKQEAFFRGSTSLIIDDASMLEDTATAALGWTCLISTLRAAAAGNDHLTRCVDLVELWTEKTRNGMDLRYLAPSDLDDSDVRNLKNIVTDLLSRDLPHAARRALMDLLLMLDPDNLQGRITWIESFQDGSKAIKSVPEKITEVLADSLYRRFPTTLLIPQKALHEHGAIVPSSIDTKPVALPALPVPDFTLHQPIGATLDSFVKAESGKTVILVGSKRVIEDLYIRHAEEREQSGCTLLCQGCSGGQSRMQAEFAVASAPALMILTPWMYETMELPAGTLQRLVIQTLPFDHPSHPVFSRRALRYRDPFSDYSLPRLKHRLFRLIRTFVRHAQSKGEVIILDDRLRTKPYGRIVSEYLVSLVPGTAKNSKRNSAEQMALL